MGDDLEPSLYFHELSRARDVTFRKDANQIAGTHRSNRGFDALAGM
jgi:hypothetical protein